MSCTVDQCERPIYYRKKNLCYAHYQRMKTYGSPLLGKRATMNGDPRKFFETVAIIYEGDDCLIWPYARDNHGYARMFDGKRMKSVSRMVCERVKGLPPSGKPHAAHSCGKGLDACVNPKHLRWASVGENMADRTLHGTDNRGERCGSSKLTEKDVRNIRSIEGVTQTFIADLYGVNSCTISDIIRRRRWGWLE